MKKTNQCIINHEKTAIIITKEFAKRSSVPTSAEYRMLAKLHKDFPEYSIQRRTADVAENKKTHEGLTLDFMSKYLARVENATAALAEFERVKDYYKGEKAYYAKVKSWFLSKYPDYESYDPSVPVPASSVEVAPLDLTA